MSQKKKKRSRKKFKRHMRNITKMLHKRSLRNAFRRFLLKKMKKIILRQSNPSRYKQEIKDMNTKKKFQLKKVAMRLNILKKKEKEKEKATKLPYNRFLK